jgi:hypothetical protein
MKITQDNTSNNTKTDLINQEIQQEDSVPGSCRIVHETNEIMQNGLSPTDTIEIIDRIQNKGTENAQDLKKNSKKEYKSHGQKPTKFQPTPIHRDESENKQKMDARLILNNNNILTEEAFTKIIRDYNTYRDSPINETAAYIINWMECQYKIKRAYQNDARVRRN